MEIRRVRAEELAEAGEVCVAAYEPFVDGPDDPYLDRLRDAAARDREGEVWVASDDGVLLGCVTVCPPGSPWRELAHDHEGEFRMLAVRPEGRGRGIGRALVDLCERQAREQGSTAMVLSSLREMADAHRLYERVGYRRDPERDWAPVPGVDLIAYVKESL